MQCNYWVICDENQIAFLVLQCIPNCCMLHCAPYRSNRLFDNHFYRQIASNELFNGFNLFAMNLLNLFGFNRWIKFESINTFLMSFTTTNSITFPSTLHRSFTLDFETIENYVMLAMRKWSQIYIYFYKFVHESKDIH